MLPLLEVDAGSLPSFPALPGQNVAATGLELSLALCSSKGPLLSHATNKHNTMTVSGLLPEAFKVVLQLLSITVKYLDAAGAAFHAVAVSGSTTFLPACPSRTASGPSLLSLDNLAST